MLKGEQNFRYVPTYHVGRDSSVGIATRYGLDGPGIESRWGRDFPHPSRPVLGSTHLVYNRYRVFPGVKRPGRGADHPPPSRKSRAAPLLSLWAFVACYGRSFTHISSLYLQKRRCRRVAVLIRYSRLPVFKIPDLETKSHGFPSASLRPS